jgi:uncharacterized protein YoxC
MKMKEYLEIILSIMLIIAMLFFMVLGIYYAIANRKRNKLMAETRKQMENNVSDPNEMMEMSKLHMKKSLEHMENVEKQLDRIATAIEKNIKSNPN